MHTPLTPTPDGITLAGIMLAKSSDVDDGRMRALLTAAQGRKLSPHTMGYIKRAALLLAQIKKEEWNSAGVHAERDTPPLAKVHMLLALSGFACTDNPQPRLVDALHILECGIKPERLLKALYKAAGEDDNEDENDDAREADDEDADGEDSGP